jgi:hypothetical protein
MVLWSADQFAAIVPVPNAPRNLFKGAFFAGSAFACCFPSAL